MAGTKPSRGRKRNCTLPWRDTGEGGLIGQRSLRDLKVRLRLFLRSKKLWGAWVTKVLWLGQSVWVLKGRDCPPRDRTADMGLRKMALKAPSMD